MLEGLVLGATFGLKNQVRGLEPGISTGTLAQPLWDDRWKSFISTTGVSPVLECRTFSFPNRHTHVAFSPLS